MIDLEFTMSYEEVEFGVSASFTAGRPGKFSGPPEDCYEDEPDIVEYELNNFASLESIILTADPMTKHNDLRAEVEKLNDRILDKAAEVARGKIEAAEEAKAEARYEEMRERRAGL